MNEAPPLAWHTPVITELTSAELEGILALGPMAAVEDGDGCCALLDVFLEARIAAVEDGDTCCAIGVVTDAPPPFRERVAAGTAAILAASDHLVDRNSLAQADPEIDVLGKPEGFWGWTAEKQSEWYADHPECLAQEPLYDPPRKGKSRSKSDGNGAADDFIRGDSRQILKGNSRNIRLAIDRLGVTFKQNDFSGGTEVHALPGFGPELTDAGAIRLRLWIEESFGFLPSQTLFEQILTDMAHASRYHPVRDYLDGLKWDGVPRIDNWLREYGGAEGTPFNRAVARIFLIAGVRRIRDPGAKFDTMLVFESPQGKDKSKALRTLAVRDEWFTDNLPLGAATKEVIEQTRGVWIAEFAELSGIERRDVNHVKNFLSKQDDRARAAYGRRTENVPRQFITAGSTNDAQYLLDIENRRFWPITIKRFDTERLRSAVPQLWAEAAHYEAEGEPVTLQEDLWAEAAIEQVAREIESPVKEALALRFGRENAGWIPAREVWEVIAVQIEQRQRLSKAVGQAMTALGFKRKQITAHDDPKGERGERFYERGEGGDRILWRV